MNTSTLTPDRQAFRAMLATLADKTKTRIPALNGRVEKAVKLALAGDVELHPDGTATVYSSSDPTRRYEIREGTCPCRDWDQAPQHLCQHRLSAGLVRRAQELLPAPGPEPVPEPPPVEPWPDNDFEDPAPEPEPQATVAATVAPEPLPEARASVNCHIMLEGRQVQITLRDTDETRLLERLAAVLRQYPDVPAGTGKKAIKSAGETPDKGQPDWCSIHNVAMKQTTKDGRSWWSHRTDDGWCKGRQR